MSTTTRSRRPEARTKRVAAMLATAVLLLAGAEADAGPTRNRIESVDHRERGEATQIRIRGTGTPTFTVYKLDRPSRVVVDISNSRLALDGAGDGKATWNLNTWAVGQISAHVLGESSGAVTRVVVGLARPGSYNVKARGQDVVVTVTARDPRPASTSAAAMERARRAKKEAQRVRAEARAARKAAADARAEARRARAEARAEAGRAKKAARAARRAAEKEKREAEAEARRAREAAERARAEAEQARAEAAERAERAEQKIAEADERAELEARRAKEAIAAARQEAEAQKKAAEEMMNEAERRMARAETIRAAATKAKKRAAAAKAEADERQEEAALARRKARRAETAAQRAAKAAARYALEAKKARGDDADALHARAEKAARAAQERRAEAEAAASEADERRRQAEAAAKAAERRRAEALAKARTARKRRAQAEEQRQLAEKRRERAEAAADEAAERAERARALRKKEESAYRKAADALAEAEERRRAAEAAAERLEASLGAMKKAAAQAEERREAAEKAARRARRTAKKAGATDEEIAKARQRARRLERALGQAEKVLIARRDDVEKSREEARSLEDERKRAAAELDELRSEAHDVRKAREREEKKLAELAEKRARAQEELEKAREAHARAVKKARHAAKKAEADDERAAKPRTKIRDVSFEDREDAARVVVALSRPAKPRVASTRGRKMVMEIDGAAIPDRLERTLDTSKFGGPVRAISSYRDPRDASKVKVVVELSERARATLKRSGTNYYWDFAKPDARRTAREVRTAEQPTQAVAGYGSSSTPITQKTVAQFGRGKKVYRGTKIDLDFKDADIHNLLRLLANVGGVDIVVPDDISARVTVRLRRVPWDQALEVILASKGLWYERHGTIYRIAPRKELDAEREAEAKRRLARAQAEPAEPEVFTLNYTPAGAVQSQVEPLLSPKGRIEVDERTNSLIINDVASHRRRIIDLLRRLDTQTPQIQIEARIVEARSTYVREFGIQWGGSANASAAGGNSTGLIFPNRVNVAGGAEDGQTPLEGVVAPSDFAVNLPAAVGTGSGGAIGVSLGSVGGNFNLALRLSALEDQGSIRIISAPKITVLNNVEATISQGVSIPISVVSANGVQTQFVPADLSLTVTPYVSQRDCSIAMDLNVTKNEADFVNTGARGDPTILRKEAETKILVADGETTVLGGVYTRNTGLSYSKVPFFGDLPVIGWFFKNRRENDERTEVLVFITPKITNKALLRCE